MYMPVQCRNTGYSVEWNLSIVDTLGTYSVIKCPVYCGVLISGGNFYFKKAHLGHRKVSLVQRCPYFRVSFKSGSTAHACTVV